MSEIVVLNGSPRKDGNTGKLVEAFASGAESAGHKVTVFSVRSTRINGCLDCGYCIKNGGKCAQKDGMQGIYDALYKADTVVFASPSYYFGWTSQLKSIIDRFYVTEAKPFPITSAAMLMAMAGESETDAAAALVNYKSVIEYLQWRDKGVVIVGGVRKRDDITGNPALLEAEELGKNM